MNFPDRAMTPSRNDSAYDSSNALTIDRVPETWGTGTPLQYDTPFQTALTPDPAPRFLYSLPSPPSSPVALSPLPAEHHPQDTHYLTINNGLDPVAQPSGSSCDSAPARMDGNLGASLSRRHTGVVDQISVARELQVSSRYANPPQQSQCEGSSGYSTGYFLSREDAANSEVLHDSGRDAFPGDKKRQGEDGKRLRH